jgi:DNA ligase (NAD+)
MAITRGNGEIGEDITHNAKFFKNIPLKINFTEELILRGEAVISYSNFERINNALEPEERYKNPRNLVSGTVRQLKSEISAGRGVMIYIFELIKADAIESDSKSERLRQLKELGFDTVESQLVTETSVAEAVKNFQDRILTNDFASDGLVLTYDSISLSQSLGATSKFPKDSIAFKWADEVAETTLLDVQWSTSRTGLINPVAVFEPVELEGTTVSQASVYNVSILRGLALGKGDVIRVYKANMIIPQIAENLTRSDTCQIPEQCPVCGSQTEIAGDKEAFSLFCTNAMCKAQLIRGLTHFASRDAMNIEGLSEQTIERFVDKGFIKNYTDIYALEKYETDIIALKGIKTKTYAKLIKAVENSKDKSLSSFIYALGINHVGLSNAKLLCGYYDNDIEKIINASPEDLSQIEGIGEIISKSVRNYFDSEKNVLLIRKILPILHIKVEQPAQLKKLAGLSFAITGSLEHFRNRAELQGCIEKHGGKTLSGVSSKTSYLINNDNKSQSSKNKKAWELGVKIITELDFINSFGGLNE